MDDASRKLVPLFNYDLQVWILDGMVQPCAHPASMRVKQAWCCRAYLWRGMTEAEAIAEHEAHKARRIAP
jgi:hypothetical protein